MVSHLNDHVVEWPPIVSSDIKNRFFFLNTISDMIVANSDLSLSVVVDFE